MHIHYFQHNHFEDLGFIGNWAKSNNVTTSVTRLDLKSELTSIEDFDWLVIMGGAMGVHDSDQYPWITEEIEFVKKAIHSGKIVIGVCLGSQMIASALGARVYKNTEPEMGFWPINFSQEAQLDSVFRHFPAQLDVMHFHFDTFTLPEGAILMASSMVTPVQAFRYGKNVFALQFHSELTESNLPVFIKELETEIIPGQLVQNPQEMFQKIKHCSINNEIFSKALDEILQLT
ncbi:MAG: type 1 glutamine amidotransferase [Bacteroidales bacterium]|nr:type 1 glutamine amidotransferase [Bacteroidales bacterium]